MAPMSLMIWTCCELQRLNLRQKHFRAALVVGSAPRKVLLGFHTLKGSRCISTTLVVLDGPSCSNLID